MAHEVLEEYFKDRDEGEATEIARQASDPVEYRKVRGVFLPLLLTLMLIAIGFGGWIKSQEPTPESPVSKAVSYVCGLNVDDKERKDYRVLSSPAYRINSSELKGYNHNHPDNKVSDGDLISLEQMPSRKIDYSRVVMAYHYDYKTGDWTEILYDTSNGNKVKESFGKASTPDCK